MLLHGDCFLSIAIFSNAGDAKTSNLNACPHGGYSASGSQAYEYAATKEPARREKGGQVTLPMSVPQKCHTRVCDKRANLGNTQNKYDLKKCFSMRMKYSDK